MNVMRRFGSNVVIYYPPSNNGEWANLAKALLQALELKTLTMFQIQQICEALGKDKWGVKEV